MGSSLSSCFARRNDFTEPKKTVQSSSDRRYVTTTTRNRRIPCKYRACRVFFNNTKMYIVHRERTHWSIEINRWICNKRHLRRSNLLRISCIFNAWINAQCALDGYIYELSAMRKLFIVSFDLVLCARSERKCWTIESDVSWAINFKVYTDVVMVRRF